MISLPWSQSGLVVIFSLMVQLLSECLKGEKRYGICSFWCLLKTAQLFHCLGFQWEKNLQTESRRQLEIKQKLINQSSLSMKNGVHKFWIAEVHQKRISIKRPKESWVDNELKASDDVIIQAEGGEIFTSCPGICATFTFSITIQVLEKHTVDGWAAGQWQTPFVQFARAARQD